MRSELKSCAGISYILITILIIYFRFLPTIVNSLVSDIIFITLLSSLVITLVASSFNIKNKSEVITFLPAALILVFFVRALPNIILEFPLFADQYYYSICTINVFEFGTIESHVTWWYPQSTTQLNWPMLHILTSQLGLVSSIDVMIVTQWIMPFVGVIFFFGIMAFSFKLYNNYGVSFLAALIGTLSISTIFYQSEYHPQGFALTLFLFVLIGFFSTRSKTSMSSVLVALIFISAFTLSHHFSSLFLSMICGMAVVFNIIILRIYKNHNKFNYLFSDISFFLIVVVSIFGFYIYVNPDLFEHFFIWSMEMNPITGNAELSKTPFLTMLLNFTKWIPIVIVILATPSIIRHNHPGQIRALLMVMLIAIAGVLGMLMLFMPLDRMLALLMPVISVICAISLYRFYNNTNKKSADRIIKIIISITIIGGILGSQVPTFFFLTSEPNSYYWYNNDLPHAVETELSGAWSISYIDNNSKYGVTSTTRSIPLLYGKISDQNIDLIDPKINQNYFIINRDISFKEKVTITTIIQENNQIYAGPDIVFYSK